MTNLLFLKPIQKRRLKSREYIVLSEDSDPIVVAEEIVNVLDSGMVDTDHYDSDFIEQLIESGFSKSKEDSKSSSSLLEKKTLKWIVARKVLLLVAVVSLIGMIISIFFRGIPTGERLISEKLNVWTNLGFILFFSMVTTLFHEGMHVVFAHSWKKTKLDMKLSLKNATATVGLTHVWTWSFLGRFTAISAGIIFDLLLLTILTYTQLWINNEFLSIASAVLWVRILWQLQFQKRNDGQILAAMSLDDPFAVFSLRSENVIVQRLVILGYVISGLLIILWLIPFFYTLIFSWI